tara:strand:- start:197 stop:364 length:168 start_codon:yes stop_codon:yes gene_type:complete
MNIRKNEIAGWSSPVARQAHNLKVVGSNPTPATKNPIDSKYLIILQNYSDLSLKK